MKNKTEREKMKNKLKQNIYVRVKELIEKEITELKKYQLEQVHMANNPAVFGEVSPNGHENASDDISAFQDFLDYLSLLTKTRKAN